MGLTRCLFFSWSNTNMINLVKNRESERGSAGIKFLIIFTVIVLAANAGFNYVPVAYGAESLQAEMEAAVLQGLALPGKLNPAENVKVRLQKAVQENGIPANALIDVRQSGNMLSAHISYTKEVNILPFGIYKYAYRFDHTATPTGFLIKQ